MASTGSVPSARHPGSPARPSSCQARSRATAPGPTARMRGADPLPASTAVRSTSRPSQSGSRGPDCRRLVRKTCSTPPCQAARERARSPRMTSTETAVPRGSRARAESAARGARSSRSRSSPAAAATASYPSMTLRRTAAANTQPRRDPVAGELARRHARGDVEERGPRHSPGKDQGDRAPAARHPRRHLAQGPLDLGPAHDVGVEGTGDERPRGEGSPRERPDARRARAAGDGGPGHSRRVDGHQDACAQSPHLAIIGACLL